MDDASREAIHARALADPPAAVEPAGPVDNPHDRAGAGFGTGVAVFVASAAAGSAAGALGGSPLFLTCFAGGCMAVVAYGYGWRGPRFGTGALAGVLTSAGAGGAFLYWVFSHMSIGW